MQLALDAEKSSADAAAVRHDRERRTRRINEMLCYSIYKRNQILPLKQQALGTSYNASSDSMNIAVRMDNCCLTVFAPYLIRLNVLTCKKIPSFLQFLKIFRASLSLFWVMSRSPRANTSSKWRSWVVWTKKRRQQVLLA